MIVWQHRRCLVKFFTITLTKLQISAIHTPTLDRGLLQQIEEGRVYACLGQRRSHLGPALQARHENGRGAPDSVSGANEFDPPNGAREAGRFRLVRFHNHQSIHGVF